MIEIVYSVDGELYASRSREHVPGINEKVKFKDVEYSVIKVVWVEDSKLPYVSVYLHEVVEVDRVSTMDAAGTEG